MWVLSMMGKRKRVSVYVNVLKIRSYIGLIIYRFNCLTGWIGWIGLKNRWYLKNMKIIICKKVEKLSEILFFMVFYKRVFKNMVMYKILIDSKIYFINSVNIVKIRIF